MTHKLQKIILPIKGMHCRSCELLLEEQFSHIKHVTKSEVTHHKGVAEIYYTQQKPAAQDLEQAVVAAGYQVGVAEKPRFFSRNPKDYKELFTAVVIVIITYGFLKLFGLTNIGFATSGSPSSLGTVVLIGLVAGFSSCMALIGGLVLGLSAKHVEKHPEATTSQKFRPHLFFNLGRISGYVILGGLLGALGSIFQLSTTITSFLTFIVSALMLFVGLQLIEIFPKFNSWKLTLPKGIAKLFGTDRHHAEYNHRNSLMVGALTFFLPCGFTQAMQIYAISTGSFVQGAMIMGLFAIGTAPGLLSIGGITSAVKGSAARKFFKVAGVVVILFALFNISNGLALVGISWGGDKNSAVTNSQDPNVIIQDGVQIVKMTESYTGYSPNNFTIRKDMPVKWIINVTEPYSCAASISAPKLGIRENLVAGENIFEFTPQEEGKIPFSCSMGMYRGAFNVVSTDGPISGASNSSTNNKAATKGSSCGLGGGGCGGCGGGARPPINANSTKPDYGSVNNNAVANTPAQIIKAVYTLNKDIQPNNFSVTAGMPVKFLIDVKDDGQGCMSTIMIPGLYNNPEYLQSGNILELDFTPTKKGQYSITCAMGVPRGVINVE